MRRRTLCLLSLICGVVALTEAGLALGQDGRDVWAFFGQELPLTAADRQRLATRGNAIVRMVPAKAGQMAVIGVTRLETSPQNFVAWINDIAGLKRSAQTPALGRFSDPPVLADLDGLVLDQRDLDAIRQCTPSRCALRLSADEIERFQRVGGAAPAAAVHEEFRRILLARLERYRSSGLAGMPIPAGRRAEPPASVFNALLTASPFIKAGLPVLASWLDDVPGTDHAFDSFFYWSKESYGDPRSAITLMHVVIARQPSSGSAPEVVVVGKQIFATRYLNGALTVTALARDGDRRYLVYLYRAQLDALRGLFGGFRRSAIESRLKDRTPALLQELRLRIEGGPPK